MIAAFGSGIIGKESVSRKHGTAFRATISEIDPVNQARRKGRNFEWVEIRYLGPDGSPSYALASVRVGSGPALDDSVSALFEAGGKNARILGWRDWASGYSLVLSGIRIGTIGFFIRNLHLGSPEKNASGAREGRRRIAAGD